MITLVLLIYLFVTQLEIDGIRSNSSNEKDSCAVAALFHLLKYKEYNNKIDFDSLLAAFPSQPKEGYSLNDMIQVTKKFNKNFTGYILAEPPTIVDDVMVVYTVGEHGHFVTLLPTGQTGEYFWLIDGVNFPKRTNMSKFVKSHGWTGKVIMRTKNYTTSIYIMYCIVCFLICGFVFHLIVARNTKLQRYPVVYNANIGEDSR